MTRPVRNVPPFLRRPPLRLHHVPIDSNNPFVCEALKRFGEDQIARALAFFESDETKVCPTFAFQDCHHPIVFVEALKMAIGGGLLPQRVNLRFTGFVYDFGKTRCFNFDKLHGRDGPPGRPDVRISTRRRRARPEKSARELRQKGSNYRCCIPALAGFVSPQSIAPDGAKISRKNGIVQSPFAANR
jgi:hypothetical protein